MTKQKAERNLSTNTIMDKLFMGASAGAIVFLAWREVLRHIQATYPVNYGFAVIAIGFLLYNVFAPFFRNRR